jgi:uncharacterized protein YfeS
MPVHMSVYVRTHRSYGSAAHGFVITSLLERAQPEFGSAIVEIHVELVRRAPSRIEAPIESDEVIMGSPVAGLPTAKLTPKNKRYALAALSRQPGDEPLPLITSMASSAPEDIQRMAAKFQAELAARKADFARKRADVDALFLLFDEVVNAMTANPPKVKPNAFNWPAFVEWFTCLRSELPVTLEGIEAALSAGHAATQARIEAMDPWARLEIDWKAFHPNARKLLPEPFYWDGGDDFAPHGNDEGSDVFAEMQKYPRNAAFTEDTFASLAGHFEHASEDEIAKADDRDETRYLDFVVAVAFGHIKLHGFCPSWLRDKALSVMTREIATLDALIERDTSGVPLSAWEAATAPHRAPKRGSLKGLIAVLERMPFRAPN